MQFSEYNYITEDEMELLLAGVRDELDSLKLAYLQATTQDSVNLIRANQEEAQAWALTLQGAIKGEGSSANPIDVDS